MIIIDRFNVKIEAEIQKRLSIWSVLQAIMWQTERKSVQFRLHQVSPALLGGVLSYKAEKARQRRNDTRLPDRTWPFRSRSHWASGRKDARKWCGVYQSRGGQGSCKGERSGEYGSLDRQRAGVWGYGVCVMPWFPHKQRAEGFCVSPSAFSNNNRIIGLVFWLGVCYNKKRRLIIWTWKSLKP